MSTSENVESEKLPVHGENNGIDQLETEETTLSSVISLPAESDQTEQRQETPHSTEADVSHKERTRSTSPSTPLSKITILLKPTADAPIMKQKKWDVEPEKKMGAIIEFIKKYLKLQKTDSLFLYVSQSFAPAPDQVIKNLYDCFGADGKLVLHYCKSQAWG